MEKQNKLVLSEEQLAALSQSLLLAMREFFNSERGKKIWAEHLKKFSRAKQMQLDSIAPERAARLLVRPTSFMLR